MKWLFKGPVFYEHGPPKRLRPVFYLSKTGENQQTVSVSAGGIYKTRKPERFL